MKKRKITLTILLVISVLAGISAVSAMPQKNNVFADTQSLCPSNIDPNSYECVEYLRKQSTTLKQQVDNISKQLKNEEYQQLTLQEKIDYLKDQIEQSEKVIQSLQVEISANDVEIKLLEKDIKEKEDNVSILKQEMDVLSESVDKRVSESYKYSFLDTFEILLDMKNISSALRKAKYLAATREKDKQYLQNYSEKAAELKKQEEELEENRAKLQIKRNNTEEEKIKLAENQQELDAQKQERENLLAQSKIKQAQLLAEMVQKRAQQVAVDAKILEYINAHMGEMINEGPVPRGGLIGYLDSGVGTCGYSTGPHLHFGISASRTGQLFYANVPIWSNGFLTWNGPGTAYDWDGTTPPQPASSGSYLMPLTGSVVVTQNVHEGDPYNYHATDLVRSDYYSTGGAAVVAAASGTLYRYSECGQGYVIIDHNNGYRTIYLHLKIQ